VDHFPKNILKLEDSLEFLRANDEPLQFLGVNIVFVVDGGFRKLLSNHARKNKA